MTSAAFDADRVRRDYRRVARFYDAWARLTESKAHARILELLGPLDSARVLEVASGTGRLLERLAAANASGVTVGVDLSPDMLRRARARRAARPGRRPLLVIADAAALPVRDAALDVLVNAYMLDLLPDDDLGSVLTEFRRVLKPGGRVAIASMAFGDRWYHGVWAWIAARAPRLLTGCRPVRVAPALRASGFTRIAAERVSQNTFPSEVLVAARPGR